MYFNIAGKEIVHLNSEDAAKEFLDKRGVKYSDRPLFSAYNLQVVTVLVMLKLTSSCAIRRIGWEGLLAFLPYGSEFQKTRKLFQEALSRSGVLVFQHIQQRQAGVFLKGLLSSPDNLRAHLKRFVVHTTQWAITLTSDRRFSYSIILEVAYGRRIETENDPYMKITEDLVRAMDGTGEPGTTMLDFFPIRKSIRSLTLIPYSK